MASIIGLSSMAVFSAEPAKKPWKNALELSVVSSNGNSKSQSASGKDTFLYEWTKSSLELIAGGMKAEDDQGTIAERYNVSEKFSYKLSDRNYAFEKFAWDKDRFAGYQGRFDAGLGLGRELIKNDKNLLIGELGGGYLKEDRIHNEKDLSFATGRAYSKYTRTLSPTSNFSQDAEYIHDMEDPDNFRVNTETAVTAAINTSMALKVSYVWKHVGEPPTGFHRNDTITTVALVTNF
ncbi:MAG: hypothetical protein KCHDKBKB_02074 [Elusimicrobia bacterium]|nr:hypothetical protein [Elusimicrobiota bacterium]